MARLPVPGNDDDVYGDVLNTFLLVAHKNNGELEDIMADTISDSAVIKKDKLTIADLRTIEGGAEDIKFLSGYYAVGDGGGGFFSWDAVSTATDNNGTIIQATGVDIGRWIRLYSGAVNVKWFGAVGDGITNDRDAFVNACAISKAHVIGKKEDVYFITHTSITEEIECYSSLISDMTIKIDEYTRLFRFKNASFALDRMDFIGTRGSFIETYVKFSAENGKDSAHPLGSVLMQHSEYTTEYATGSIFMTNCTFTDIPHDSCLKAGTHGEVFTNNIKVKNVAGKVVYTVHGTGDGASPASYSKGTTILNNIKIDDLATMPDSFYYDNTVDAVYLETYGSVSAPYPADSFGCLTTYGDLRASNVTSIGGYGTAVVTYNWCDNAYGSNISIWCDNEKSISNNPSGGIWGEFCGAVQLDNIDIKLLDRGADVGLPNALLWSTQSGSVNIFNNINILANGIAIDNTAFKIISKGNSKIKISNSVINNGYQNTDNRGFYHAYQPDATIKDEIDIDNTTIRSYKMLISPCSRLSIADSKIYYYGSSYFFNYDSGVAGISNLQEEVIFNNLYLYTQASANTTYDITRFTINGLFVLPNPATTAHDANFTFALANNLMITNSRFNGSCSIGSVRNFTTSNSTYRRRLDIWATEAGQTVDILNITGCTVTNDLTDFACINVRSAAVGTITGNSLLHDTGLTGIGYVIGTLTDIVESGNQEKQLSYVVTDVI